MGLKRSLKYEEMKYVSRMVGKHLKVAGFLEREKWELGFGVVKLVE